MQLTELKFVERGKIDTPNTQIHYRCFFWVSTGTIKSGGFKLVLWTQTLITLISKWHHLKDGSGY
jgi:hypothetical protein